ncbi:MAG: DUF4190 domain-containing protein [Planctomycetota bacterium]|jgi:hypothetical protein
MTEAEKKVAEQKPKVSKLAITSLFLSLTGFCTRGVTAIVSLVMGIIALVIIGRSSVEIRGRHLAIVGIIISVFILSVIGYDSLPSVNIKRTLGAGRLADLPKTATDVKIDGWHSLFTGEDYIRFKAAPEDIEKFISDSPSIKEITPKVFTSEHMHLPQPDTRRFESEEDWEDFDKHEYYYGDGPYCPKWYDPTIKTKGRLYKIPSVKGHNSGTVIINDEANTVYIHVIWS